MICTDTTTCTSLESLLHKEFESFFKESFFKEFPLFESFFNFFPMFESFFKDPFMTAAFFKEAAAGFFMAVYLIPEHKNF